MVSWLCRHWPHLSLRQFWFQETCLSCCLTNDNKMRAFGRQPSPSSGTNLGLCMENMYGTQALVRLLQQGEPNQPSQTLAQMWEVGGWGCLPTWHMVLQHVCIFMCVSSLCRLHPSALSTQEQFPFWCMCLQAPRNSAGNLP